MAAAAAAQGLGFQPRVAMGSVSDNYRCPTCGRTGNGGYVLDGMRFPVCNGGDNSCLGKLMDEDAFSARDIIFQALSQILRPWPTEVVWAVSKFLIKG